MTLTNAQVRATVAVSDLDRAVQFYEGALGLKSIGNGDTGEVKIYPCGNGTLQVYRSEHAGTNTATSASFSADDFDSTVAELAANGVTFERYDGMDADERGVHTFGEHQVCWFKDPDGNVIALDNGRG